MRNFPAPTPDTCTCPPAPIAAIPTATRGLLSQMSNEQTFVTIPRSYTPSRRYVAAVQQVHIHALSTVEDACLPAQPHASSKTRGSTHLVTKLHLLFEAPLIWAIALIVPVQNARVNQVWPGHAQVQQRCSALLKATKAPRAAPPHCLGQPPVLRPCAHPSRSSAQWPHLPKAWAWHGDAGLLQPGFCGSQESLQAMGAPNTSPSAEPGGTQDSCLGGGWVCSRPGPVQRLTQLMGEPVTKAENGAGHACA